MDGTIFMVTWSLYDSDENGESWDELLSVFEHRSYAQLYRWGEYKKKLGWHVLRVVAENDKGECIALAQSLYKTYPLGLAVMWVPGGPTGDMSSINKALFDTLHKNSRCKFLYCRISPFVDNGNLQNSTSWRQVRHALNSNKSMMLELSDYDFDSKNKLTKNWKKNLRRSGNYDLISERIENPNYQIIESIYRDMEQYKGIDIQYSSLELKNIFRFLSRHVTLFICKNGDGDPIAVRGCIIHKDKAWDFIAASNQESRKKYASYKLLWDVIEYCSSKNVYSYDMGGIDPVNNTGVWNFKKGTGATEIIYEGEYEKASIPLLASLMNLYIKYLK